MLGIFSTNLYTACFWDIFDKRGKVVGNRVHVKEAINWLKTAQDKTNDGGVAAWYSLLSGWAPSYIETTGYIIITFLKAAEYLKDKSLTARAMKMGDFLLTMECESGGYRSRVPSQQESSKPTIFNTGQDILGLIELYKVSCDRQYLDSAIRAADFLLDAQSDNGSWTKFQFGKTIHTYDTRVALALLKVWEITKEKKYHRAALKTLDWASRFQRKNGWFEKCEFPSPDPKVPYTHAISYVVEGFLYSGILLKNDRYILVAKKTADAILDYFLGRNFIPGTFNGDWESKDSYSCLTGDAQISIVWLELYRLFKDKRYLKGSRRMNSYLKSTQNITTSHEEIRGAIKGSHPIYGDIVRSSGYSRMAYLNWATKFFVDALILEDETKI